MGSKRDVNTDVKIITKFIEKLTDESDPIFNSIHPDVIHAIDNIAYNSKAENDTKACLWNAILKYNSKRVALPGKKSSATKM